MLLTNDGKQYVNVTFDNEEELEKVVLDSYEMLFGELSFVLPKRKIATVDGAGTIPDGIIIDLKNREWLILEAELAHHGTWRHIAPQISKQITAMNNEQNKNKLLDLARTMISEDEDLLLRIQEELEVAQIDVHAYLSEIFQTKPLVAIPIDEVPRDLTDWAGRLCN